MEVNCWEFKKCGKEFGGNKVDELGVCPAVKEKKVDGINNGKNAGRCCWAISGTLCDDKVQGTFSQKVLDCMVCDFYRMVMKEEGTNFTKPDKILELLRED